MPGEFDFINWVRGQEKSSPLLLVPPGDDLAVLKWPADDLLLVGVDQVLDGVHFDSAVHSPRQIGRKVMNRNLSDCAAMACLPAAAVATVAAPRGTPLDYLKELYLGLRDAAHAFQCAVVGGDTAAWDGRLALTVTILGRSAGIEPVTRGGAKLGHGIFVTGPLGGSILGRHLTFEPRVNLARELAKTGAISSMIDLSDGLSRDVRHLCEASGLAALIDGDRVPIREEAHALFRQDRRSPLEHALHDGEDYELLFTGPVEECAALGTQVGIMLVGSGVTLRSQGKAEPLAPGGWEHPLG
jgi:thiamine-monophosphate kinase